MVTKLTKIISNSPFATWNVRGYESGKLIIKADSVTGSSQLGFYVSHDDTNPSYDKSPRAKAYYKGKLLTSNLVISKAGEHVIDIDLNNVNKIILALSNKNYEGTAVFSTSFQPYEVPVEEVKVGGMLDILRAGDYIDLPVDSNSKQLDFTVTGRAGGSYFRLQGSNDDFLTIENIPFIDTLNKIYRTVGWTDLRTYARITGFANIEKYRRYRFVVDEGECIVSYSVSKEYVDGRKLPDLTNISAAGWDNLKGYKAVKFSFLNESVVEDCSVRGEIVMTDRYGKRLPHTFYTSDFKIIDSYFINNVGEKALELYGKPRGEIVVAVKEPILRPSFSFTAYDIIADGNCELHYETTFYAELPQQAELRKIVSRNDYDIYSLPSNTTRKDVYNNDVLEYTNTTLTFFMCGYYGIKYSIPFTTKNVPALQTGEIISFAYLLPFDLSNRSGATGSERYPSRIVIFTNKNRIFHNFPVRGSGASPNSDLYKFDESAVYNLQKKWLPTNDKGKAGSRYKYLPVLKDYDYEQFNGRIAGTPGFVDHYENGGIRDTTYIPLDFRIKGQIGYLRLTLNNIAKSAKRSVFGNYNGKIGEEPFVIVTNDGGRKWYVHAYFACTDYYNYMRGGNIDFTPISSVAPFVTNSLKMCRRRFNFPTAEVKELTTPFIIKNEEKSLVTAIEIIDGETVITVADNVDYDGKFPVVYFENVSANTEWNYICNNDMSESGSNSNGVFFRAQKVAANKYKLFDDLGNPYESDLLCRHVHAVNACSSGFLISTGESYFENGVCEGGFLYYMQQNSRNGGNTPSVTALYPLIRLNSAAEGVNRACGAYMFNDELDPTIMYASDEAFETVAKRYTGIPGRTKMVRNIPAGIFRGKLSDIDDQSKFTCVCESQQTILSLVQHQGHFAADGHTDALMVSRDGKNWNIERNTPDNAINGTDNEGNIYFGHSVIKFK